MTRTQPKRVVRPAGLAPRLVGASPEPETLPTPKRRGRPPKFGVAMTTAERKVASRAWQKEKQQDQERRKLVAEIVKIYRREISKPGGDITATRETTINAGIRKYFRYLNDALLQEPIEQLRTVLETKKNSSDLKGRLHNERSGEDERKAGQSEIERIIGRIQYDITKVIPKFWMNPTTILTSEADDEQSLIETAKQTAANFQVRPKGAGPDKSEVDSTGDSSDEHHISPIPDWKPTADEQWLKKAIASIVSKLNLSFDSDGAQCPFCGEHLLIKDAAFNHLEEQFEKDIRDYQNWFDITWSLIRIHENGGPWVEPGPVPKIPHLHGIKKEIELVKKQARKKPQEAGRNLNLVTQSIRVRIPI